MNRGFTLIEMAIVLVIIGLIIGAVLVGKNLIDAAAVRAQVSQIEKYNQAVNTFREKYGYLPGDMTQAAANQFGFLLPSWRTGSRGRGDGNGAIEGISYGGVSGVYQTWGETEYFWLDLMTAGFVDNSFAVPGGNGNAFGANAGLVYQVFPPAKIGNGNFVYVWSGGYFQNFGGGNYGDDYMNYFGLSGVTCVAGYTSTCNGVPQAADMMTTTAITVAQAYAIDMKMDDGLPQSGRVLALYLFGPADNHAQWAGITLANTNWSSPAPGVSVPAASTATCFDNTYIPAQYSLATAAGLSNCALSFRFQ